ncbi:DUF951 domain-containing protein [Chthonomonas calidirosea]|uniref:DUF951 domain-containing protein n=1 Tax=Chthonomonas calidirosea TaxID=454171 RepID=UPI0006EC622B|nr:DUF951 domain-containing protein [Chthonomonas calidirosea]CEK19981.1 hypothetical protein CP488_02705 [Chthonomonas calidirosea]
MPERIPIKVGMTVQLRKKHPCGGDLWTVTYVGADIAAVCMRCRRRVMLPREEFERRIRKVLSPDEDASVRGKGQ